MAVLKLTDYIAKRLKDYHGIEHFFMVSGGGAMHLNDSLGRYISYTCNHNEQACAIAAEGYARVNQRLALVNVTTGPGGLNCLNGVFGQWTDSVPVLYISGQVKFSTTIASCPEIPLRQLGDQEVDIIRVVSPLVKFAQTVTNPYEIKFLLDKAVHEATSGRFGPVWLDIPMNVQSAVIDEDDLLEFSPESPPGYDLKLDKLVKELEKAKRPVVIAGHGIRLSGQEGLFQELLKRLDCPVVTTFNGFDLLPSNYPNYVGRIGTIGQRSGNIALQNADLVLCLGSRNNIRQASYNYENYAKNAFKIVVDIDQAELDKPTVIPDLKIQANLKDFLPAFLAMMPSLKYPEWMSWCKARQRKYDFYNTVEYQQRPHEPLNPYYFVRKLTEHMREYDILVMANGSACVCPFQVAEIKANQRFILNSGDASMGYDLPAAIGACFACKGRNVICLAGDGSIMMNIQELQTIKHSRLPIKVFILNNNGYISIQQTHNNFFNGHLTGCDKNSGVTLPDFVALAKAFGINAVRLNSADKCQTVLATAMSSTEPVVIEVVVASGYSFIPKLSARRLEDGTIVSPSLEDMSPFLPKDEYDTNVWRNGC